MLVWQHSKQSKNLNDSNSFRWNEYFLFLLRHLFWFTQQHSRISWTSGTGNEQVIFLVITECHLTSLNHTKRSTLQKIRAKALLQTWGKWQWCPQMTKGAKGFRHKANLFLRHLLLHPNPSYIKYLNYCPPEICWIRPWWS